MTSAQGVASSGTLDPLAAPAMPNPVETPLRLLRALQAWAALAAAAWVAVVVAAASVLVHDSVRHDVREAQAAGQVEVEFVARLLEQRLQQAENMAAMMALQDDVVRAVRALNGRAAGRSDLSKDDRYRALTADADAQSLNLAFTRLTQSFQLPHIYLLDRDGLCIASSQWNNPAACVGESYRSRDYFRQAMERGTGRQFAIGLQSRTPSLFFAVAVRDARPSPSAEEGSALGTVVVRTTSEDISQVLPANDHWETLVIDGRGVIIGATSPDLVLSHIGPALAAPPSAEVLRTVYGRQEIPTLSLRRGNEPLDSSELWTLDGAPVLQVGTALSGGDLTIIRLRPAHEALARDRNGWRVAGVALVIGLLLILLAERTLDFAARRRASLRAISLTNATLSRTAEQLRREAQAKTRQAELASALQQAPDLPALARIWFNSLAAFLPLHQATLYLAEAGDDGQVARLRLAGLYATAEAPGVIRLGEGLLGQCAADLRPQVHTLPQDSVWRIDSGLGRAVPRVLLVLPLMRNDRLQGVLECASLEAGFATARADIEPLLPLLAMNLELLLVARRTESLLAQSRQGAASLHTVFSALPEALVIVGEDGRIMEVNQCALHLLGLTAGDLRGRPLTAMLDGGPVGTAVEACRFRRPDGSAVPVLARRLPVDAGGVDGCLVLRSLPDQNGPDREGQDGPWQGQTEDQNAHDPRSGHHTRQDGHHPAGG